MSVSSESVAGTVGEVLQQKLQVLFGGLQPGLTFQSEGAEGGKLIYPQATAGAEFLYYPTFSSFNRQVEFNASGNANVFQLSPSELTVYLQAFYATLVDQLSSQAQAQLSEDRQNQNKKIQLLFGNLIPGLGVQSDLWNDAGGLDSTWSWAAIQFTPDAPDVPSDQGLSANSQWTVLQNSIPYICQQATQPQNAEFALQESYQDTSWISLSNQLVAGQIDDWSDVFTDVLTDSGQLNPWSDDAYDDFKAIVNSFNQTNSVVASVASNSARVQSAGSYLQYYNSADLQSPDSSIFLSGMYANVVNAEEGGYPFVVPDVDYMYQSEQIEDVLNGGGEFIEIKVVEASDAAQAGLVLIESSGVSGYNVSADINDWSFVESSLPGSDEDVAFSQYDNSMSVAQGSFQYNSVGVQLWMPSESGSSAWFLPDVISSAVKSKTPYVYSSNFDGGYGWTNSWNAAAFTQAGFAYISALAFAGSAVSEVSGSTSNSSVWSSSTFDSSNAATNYGLSFSDWYGMAVTSSEASSQSVVPSQSSGSSSSETTWSMKSDPMGPISDLPPSTTGGMPALQVGTGYQVLAEPNDSYGSEAGEDQRSRPLRRIPATKKYGSKGNVHIDSLWVVCDGSVEDDNKYLLNYESNIAFGSNLSDHVIAAEGDDDLFGHGRADTLKGGSGRDFISGGLGVNRLHGGAGSDSFEFDGDLFSRGFKHFILDFKPEKDMIWFTKGWNPSLFEVRGDKLRYSDKTIGVFEGLDFEDVAQALDDAVFL